MELLPGWEGLEIVGKLLTSGPWQSAGYRL